MRRVTVSVDERKLKAVVFVSLLVFGLFAGWNLRGIFASSSTPVISPQSFTEAYSYTIWVSSGTYYSKSGATGEVTSGTNASQIMQSAINGLSVGRSWKETILLKGDLGEVYNIYVPSYTIIQGEEGKLTLPTNKGFIFTGSSGIITNVEIKGLRLVAEAIGRSVQAVGIDLSAGNASVDNILIENNIFQDFRDTLGGTPSAIRGRYDGLQILNNIFANGAGAGNAYPIYISGLSNKIEIKGNRINSPQVGNLIYVYNSYRVTITNNFLDGISETADIEGIALAGSQEVIISNNNLINFGVAAILLHSATVEGSTTDVTISGNFIENVKKSGNGRAIYVWSDDATYSDRIQIFGNTIIDSNTGVASGILGANEINKLQIFGNHIENVSYPVTLYQSHNTRLYDNVFRNYINAPYIESGTLFIKSNEGFTTENSGTATGTSPITVASGLQGQADYITLGGTGATALKTSWANINATHFYIYHDSGGSSTITWYAEYKP